MDKKDMKTYLSDRKFHEDPIVQQMQLFDIQNYVIHNAYQSDEWKRQLDMTCSNYLTYTPKNSAETHFYDLGTKTLHAINTRGEIRLIRDINQHKLMEEVVERPINLFVDHWQGDVVEASRRFLEFAYDLNTQIYSHINKDLVKGKGKMDLIIGPMDSLDLEDFDVMFDSKNDYLNYRVLRSGDKQVVNLDYIFADQAKNILDKFFMISNAYFSGIDINIYHYGRVGILNPEFAVGDFCIPTGALDEQKISEGRARVFPIYNRLAEEGMNSFLEEKLGSNVHEGFTVNTISVLEQTQNQLKMDLKAGGDFLDMEWLSMAVQDYNTIYPTLGNVNFYLVGVGSDKQLEGLNLGNTIYSKENEKKVTEMFKDLILA